jgi:hypothetical protein
MWWRVLKEREVEQPEINEEEDGRFESEGSEGRVSSEGYAEGCDGTKV